MLRKSMEVWLNLLKLIFSITKNMAGSESRHRHAFFLSKVHTGSNLHTVLFSSAHLGPDPRDHPTRLQLVGKED